MTLATMAAMATRIAAPWAHLYNDHPVLQTSVTAVHVSAMLLAGGFAIATDRATVRAARAGAGTRLRALQELRSVHPFVLVGLALVTATGVLMLGADLKTLLGSPVLWAKLGLFAALLANGGVMVRVEHGLRSEPGSEARWRRLRATALASLVLWFAVAVSGTALVNAA